MSQITNPISIAEIQAHLDEVPAKTCQRFATLLIEAQTVQDIEQIERLAEAATPFLSRDSCLQDWHIYATGFLDLVLHNEPDQAVENFEALYARSESLPIDLCGRVLNGLGIIYESMELWDKATSIYQECIDFCESQGDDLGIGKALYNLAIIYYKGLDYPTAISYAKRSITLLRRHPDQRAWQTNLAGALNELGLALMEIGDLAQAAMVIKECLETCQRWSFLLGEGVANTNLGHIARQTNHKQQAEAYYIQARNISFKAQNLGEAAEAIYGLGLLKSNNSNEVEAAKVLFDEALQLALSTNNHEIITKIYLSLADIYDKIDNRAAARETTRLAVETVESLRANLTLPETRIRLHGSRIMAYEQMVRRLCQDSAGYAEAFHYAERAKSRALIEMLAGRSPRPSKVISPEWISRADELRVALQQLYTQSEPPYDQIASLEAEWSALHNRIRQQDAEFDSFQIVAPLTLDQVTARLPQDSVLLEYFIAEDLIFAFVITPMKTTVVPLPIRASQITDLFVRRGGKQISHLPHLVPDLDGRLRQPWILHKLGQSLLNPLGDIIWSASLIYIVPHGILHYIPFHALCRKVNDTEQYLIGDDDHIRHIVYAPSATTLFEYCRNKHPSMQQGSLTLGHNGDMLLEAESEAMLIAKMIGGQALVGIQATRDNLLEQATHYRYLHIACHGAFNPTWPMGSSLSLADGPFDVADILQNLQLDADLVCLSACETGQSHVLLGDELIGFARVCLYAGTPSVLVSQWVVDDLSTRLLMAHFYQTLQSLSKQKSSNIKAEALAQAQRYLRSLTLSQLRDTLMANQIFTNVDDQLDRLVKISGYDAIDDVPADVCLFAHPYFWAPFFLIGDGLID